MAEPPAYPGRPRWVKVLGIVALLVVLLFVHRLFTAGVEHGQHNRSHGPGSHGSPADATERHAPSGAEHR
jgi:hypothetical protein